MPAKRRTPYILAGTFTGKDGRRYTFRAPTGSSNPEDVQYQAAKKRIARAVLNSPKYDGHSEVTFKLEGKE